MRHGALRLASLLLISLAVASCDSGPSHSVTLRKKIAIPIEKASTLAFSEDGSRVAVTGYNKKIVVVDVDPGLILADVDDAHHGRVLQSVFIDHLYTSGVDTIKAWEPSTGHTLAVMEAGGKVHRSEFYGVIASSAGGTRTGRFTASSVDGTVEYFGVDPDEAYLLSLAKQKKKHALSVWNIDRGSRIRTLDGVQDAVLSTDGRLVAVNHRTRAGRVGTGPSVTFKYDNSVTLYSVPDFERRDILIGLWLLAFSPKGTRMLAQTDDEELVVKSAGGDTLAWIPFEDRVRFARFTDDDRFVLLSGGSRLACFEIATEKQLWSADMDADEAGDVIRITPDDRYVIFKSGGSRRFIRFVAIATGAEAARITDKAIFTGFALSPDGRTLATTLYKGGLALWDLGL